MQIRGAIFTGLMLAASMLGASAARGREPLLVAQAEADTPAGSEASQPSGTPTTTTPGIEERVILAGESEAVADFDAGDSVTGFDASDLQALGAESVADLAKYTPNLEIVTAGQTVPTFFIRGVGLNDFNPNSTGAVALYQDDVPISSPALQLPMLFDMERVNVLRGPQGTGAFRNASAGAIKLYSRKPTGRYSAYLHSSFGNYDYRDFEGAIEAPVYEDILSSRLAFRLRQRDGYATNGCGDAPPMETRPVYPEKAKPVTTTDPAYSICGEDVFRVDLQRWDANGIIYSDGRSIIPEGLPSKVNDLGVWAARGTLRFQPTLDMDWLLNAHVSRRDELTRLGQAYGTGGGVCDPSLPDDEMIDCINTDPEDTPYKTLGVLGEKDSGSHISGGYQPAEVKAMLAAVQARLRPAILERLLAACDPCTPQEVDAAGRQADNIAHNNAKIPVAEELAKNLDSDPHHGDYDRVGPTKNDTWGGFLKGDIVLPSGINLTTVTGYNTYDRLIDIDLDFSPNQLFEIETKDEGWQFTQDLRAAGEFSELGPLRWELGGLYLMEDIHVHAENEFGETAAFNVAERDYTQKTRSMAGYAKVDWDFWRDFSLDGGYRFNWERKTLDYSLLRGTGTPNTTFLSRTWSAPTGTVRLTYRFREDTHVFWKYSRGWKSGHYNATPSNLRGVTVAEPEIIDAHEVGLRGSWFEGRLDLDLSFFYYSYDQYQIFTVENDADATPEFVVLNANDAEVYGSEATIGGRPWPGADLKVGFSWLETQFLDFVQTQIEQRQVGYDSFFYVNEINHTGNSALNSPRFKLSLRAEQTLPLGRWGSLTARYDGAWSDDTYYDATEGRGLPNQYGDLFLPENTIGQRAFWLHNVRLAYRTPGGAVEVAGFVRNVADKVYKSFAFDAVVLRDTTIQFVGEPRTYGLTISADF